MIINDMFSFHRLSLVSCWSSRHGRKIEMVKDIDRYRDRERERENELS